jgi:hypothetical protein
MDDIWADVPENPRLRKLFEEGCHAVSEQETARSDGRGLQGEEHIEHPQGRRLRIHARGQGQDEEPAGAEKG